MTGITQNYNITTNRPANLAVNSNDFTQNLTVEQKTGKVIEVAEALEKYVADAPATQITHMRSRQACG